MSSSLLWYTTRATGLVALLLLTLTLVLGIGTANRFSMRSWPRFAQQDLHKRVSLITLVFLAIHVLTSVMDTYVNIGWAAILLPFTSRYDSFWVALGTVGVDVLAAVAVSSMLRNRIPARLWRGVHWLSYLSWPVALAHAFGMGTDMNQAWATGLAIACIFAVVGACVLRVRLAVAERRRTTNLTSLRAASQV